MKMFDQDSKFVYWLNNSTVALIIGAAVGLLLAGLIGLGAFAIKVLIFKWIMMS